jgi:Mrp family chromosome partitioning ATPase
MDDTTVRTKADRSTGKDRGLQMTQVQSGEMESSSIVPTSERLLAPQQLEERKIIHRAESLRDQADAFRDLRTRLCAELEGTAFVTLVVPVLSGCGSSFVARNLAAAFAFDETRSALLVDCNARYPSQAAVFGMSGDAAGLKDYLYDNRVTLASVMCPSGLPRLEVLPWGARREDAGDAFGSSRMRMLLDSLRAQDDRRHVILDGPAVNDGPDATILSRLADRVILVTAYGLVTPEAVRTAVAAFPAEKVAGVVFNQRP